MTEQYRELTLFLLCTSFLSASSFSEVLPCAAGPKPILATPPQIPCPEAPKPLLAYPVATTNSIKLYWPTNQYRRGVEIARRVYTNNPNAWTTWTYLWGFANANANQASNYTDSTVSSGIHYEYRLGNLVTNWACNCLILDGKPTPLTGITNTSARELRFRCATSAET